MQRRGTLNRIYTNRTEFRSFQQFSFTLPSVPFIEMDIFSCPLCGASFESILRPVILPCRHFILCRNCIYTADSYTCETCSEQFYYSNLSVDESLAEWLEQAKQELDGVAREDGKWRECEQYLREYMGERKKEEEVDALVDVSQWPVREWQGREGGQWTCEVCGVAVLDTRYRCTSCGRVDFAAFEALHREEGAAATALAQQILQLASPQPPTQANAAVPPGANGKVLAFQPPKTLPVANPVSVPTNQRAGPPKTVSLNTPVPDAPDKQASIPAANRQIAAEQEKQASLPANTEAIIPQFISEQAEANPNQPSYRKPPKHDRDSNQKCCSLF